MSSKWIHLVVVQATTRTIPSTLQFRVSLIFSGPTKSIADDVNGGVLGRSHGAEAGSGTGEGGEEHGTTVH